MREIAERWTRALEQVRHWRAHSALRERWRESARSVLPIAGLVLVLCFLTVPLPVDALAGFGLATALLILGMGLFNQGTDLAMTPIGEGVGKAITHSRNVKLLLITGFLVGLFVTMAEPDLTVLANQVASIPNLIMISAVALGVGIFLALALARILWRVPLWALLLGSYGLIFVLSFLIPRSFLSVAFDAGGVTTGPMTVPFILGLGAGVAASRGDKGAETDSFGLVALASAGPILAVMILSIIYNAEDSEAAVIVLTEASTSTLLFRAFTAETPVYCLEVLKSLAPVLVFFLFFQFFSLKIKGQALQRIITGLFFTYFGLVIFLLGVNVGFMPVGNFIGETFGGSGSRWLLVPLGMLIGWFTVSAEPAVQVLNTQVYEMTAGAIPKKALSLSLSVGVSISVGLSLLRVLLGIPILCVLIPGYALAMLLMLFSPPIFTAIAFDSGGVASGPMTASFLLPMAIGACRAAGGNVVSDAFGVVALVAMTPLIAIQVLGILFRLRQQRAEQAEAAAEEIIEL